MKIALIGYGKMGKTIEQLSVERGHEIVARIGKADAKPEFLNGCDVIIEFTTPESAFENVSHYLKQGLPVVCGTTGWNAQLKDAEQLAQQHETAFFYASNFSIGVNLFFEISKKMSALLSEWPEYNLRIEETHHIHKKDKPSGTAITLAQNVISNNHNLEQWQVLEDEINPNNTLPIIAHRENEVFGNHSLIAENDIDIIELKHIAKNRHGFALGAILAAEFIQNKKGFFGMSDLIKQKLAHGI